MITTTAVVSALVCIELLKIHQNRPIEELKNGFVNLALPFVAFSEPLKPPTTKIRDGWEWTLWDRFEVDGELTLQEFIEHFKVTYYCVVLNRAAKVPIGGYNGVLWCGHGICILHGQRQTCRAHAKEVKRIFVC